MTKQWPHPLLGFHPKKSKYPVWKAISISFWRFFICAWRQHEELRVRMLFKNFSLYFAHGNLYKWKRVKGSRKPLFFLLGRHIYFIFIASYKQLWYFSDMHWKMGKILEAGDTFILQLVPKCIEFDLYHQVQ